MCLLVIVKKKGSLYTIFENKKIVLPSIIITNYISLYFHIFWQFDLLCGLSEPYSTEKNIQMLIPYMILVLLELFEKISKFHKKNLFKTVSG